jgi:hypothetical protein
MNGEMDIMNSLCETWGVDQTQILPTAIRFFNEYKKLSSVTKKQDQQILNLQVKFVINAGGDVKNYFVKSEQETPTLYFSFLPQFAHTLKEQEKGVIFVGGGYVLGLLGTDKCDDLVNELEACCKEMSSKPVKMTKKGDVKFDFKIKGQKPIVTKGICQFNITGADFKEDKIVEIMKKYNVVEME